MAIALGSIALLTFAGCKTISKPGEPTYSGKPVSLWLEALRVCKTEKEFVVASNAVHHIGSNAMPYLLRILRGEIPPSDEPMPPKEAEWKYFLKTTVGTDESAVRLALACRVLGSSAAPVITELKNIIGNPSETDHRAGPAGISAWDRAVGILLNMHAEGILPLLQGLREAAKTAPGRGSGAVTSLQHLITKDPAGLLPRLMSILKQPDEEMRSSAQQLIHRAFYDLSELATDKADVDRLFPVISDVMQHGSDSLRAAVLNYLYRCETNAKRASPLAVKALSDPSEPVRVAAKHALSHIDPETAAKHGVK
jgi:hypothetical protein